MAFGDIQSLIDAQKYLNSQQPADGGSGQPPKPPLGLLATFAKQAGITPIGPEYDPEAAKLQPDQPGLLDTYARQAGLPSIAGATGAAPRSSGGIASLAGTAPNSVPAYNPALNQAAPAPIANNSNALSRALPMTTAVANQPLVPGQGLFNTMGQQIRRANDADSAFFSDTMSPIFALGQGAIDAGRNFVNGVMGNTSKPVPPLAMSPPGQRFATQGSPSAVASVQAPTNNGAMDQFGTNSPNAPATTTPVTGITALAQNALSRTLAPSIGNSADMVTRGNGGIAALAGNPNAQGQFNDLQAARGNGITAATDSNGRLALTNIGANGQANPVTQPQNITQGYDLAGANDRLRASLDAGYESDRKAQIADLTQQLNNSNAPPGSARALALTNQIAALSQVQQSGQATTARAGLETAQAGLANTQAAVDKDKLATSQAAAKQLSQLQTRYLAESDPAKAKVLGDKMLVMLGKDPKEGFQISTQQELADPANPGLGLKSVPFLINQQTGFVQRLDEAAQAGGFGNKGTNYPVPLPNHISLLKDNPTAAAQTHFDDVYGPGAAKKALGSK